MTDEEYERLIEEEKKYEIEFEVFVEENNRLKRKAYDAALLCAVSLGLNDGAIEKWPSVDPGYSVQTPHPEIAFVFFFDCHEFDDWSAEDYPEGKEPPIYSSQLALHEGTEDYYLYPLPAGWHHIAGLTDWGHA